MLSVAGGTFVKIQNNSGHVKFAVTRGPREPGSRRHSKAVYPEVLAKNVDMATEPCFLFTEG